MWNCCNNEDAEEAEEAAEEKQWRKDKGKMGNSE